MAGSSGILNKAKAPATATGYKPIPPFVAAILNPPAIKPTKTAPKGTLRPSMAGIVAQNMAIYINQINTVCIINGHLAFILKILLAPSIKPNTKFLTFKPNPRLAFFTNRIKTTIPTTKTASNTKIFTGEKFLVSNS